jgi:hypothetical protein
MGNLLKARGDCELAFTVRVELTGKEPPNEQVVEEVNRILREVSDGFSPQLGHRSSPAESAFQLALRPCE